MSARERYLGVIPARGGSKRIPRKNVTLLGGRPLIAHTLAAARQATRLGRTIVSTDDEEIAAVARAHGGDVPFLRPAELARDETATAPVLQHALAQLAAPAVDAVVILQPTSPFRTAQHIDAAIALFESSGADTVTAVCPAHPHPFYAWTLAGDELVPLFSMEQQLLVRQQLPPALLENGAVYVIRRALIERGQIYGKRIIPYLMDESASLDIDTPEQLRWAELRFLHGSPE